MAAAVKAVRENALHAANVKEELAAHAKNIKKRLDNCAAICYILICSEPFGME